MTSTDAAHCLHIVAGWSWPDIRRLLNGLLHLAHLANGVLSVHGTAVGAGGDARLLLGDHGTGKTLVSLHLVMAGWTALAGDVALIHVRDGRAVVVGGTQSMLARRESLHRLFPSLAAVGVEREFTPSEPRVDVAPLVRMRDPAAGPGYPLVEAIALAPSRGGGALRAAVPAERLQAMLQRASAHHLDRVVDALDLPLRLLETPSALRQRISLCRTLAARLSTVEVAGSAEEVARDMLHRNVILDIR